MVYPGDVLEEEISADWLRRRIEDTIENIPLNVLDSLSARLWSYFNKSHCRALFQEVVSDERVKELLQKLRSYHRETYGHSLRVGLYSIDLGLFNHLDDEKVRLLGYGGVLHDIGKLDTLLTILDKKDKLTVEEKEIIDRHPRQGFDRLARVFADDIRKIVVAHHEYKNNPYPRKTERKKSDEEALDLAEIVAVADIYDALAYRRSYKGMMSDEEIRTVLQQQYLGDRKYIKQALLIL